MADLIQSLRRRLEHYMRNSGPRTIIRIADFLRSISKDDDSNKKLLDVSDRVRKQYRKPPDKL